MRSRFGHVVLLWLCALPALAAAPRDLDVHVKRVVDGDTLVVVDSNRLEHRIRLSGIDAPEQGQPFSDRSRQHLVDMVQDKDVRLTWSKTDSYGRFVAKVTLQQRDCPATPCNVVAVDVNLAQLAAGMAWHFKRFEREQDADERRQYVSAEQRARSSDVGLWADADPVAPWDWRQRPAEGPVRKSRNDICHEPSMSTYGSVKRFEAYDSLEECLASGGRLPRGSSR